MATATQRAEVGAEEARLEGRGRAGEAAEAARNVATGRDEPGVGGFNNGVRNNGVVNDGVGPINEGVPVGDRGLLNRNRDGVGPFNEGVPVGEGLPAGDRGLVNRNREGVRSLGASGPRDGGVLGNVEEEFARLRTKTRITAEGDAYCPNPNLRDLPKEFETRVQVIQRYPEMRTVEKTDFIKEIVHEDRVIIVQRTRVIHDDVERIDRVPVVRQVPRTRMETVFRTVAEEREVVDMVQEVEYIDVPRIELVPRVITEDIEERVIVPVVREVPVTRMVEVPTGNYCEAPVGQFINPGDFDLLRARHGHTVGGGGGGILGGILHRKNKSVDSVSSSDEDEAIVGGNNAGVVENADGTVTPVGGRRKKSLLRRVLNQ